MLRYETFRPRSAGISVLIREEGFQFLQSLQNNGAQKHALLFGTTFKEAFDHTYVQIHLN